MAQGSIVGTQPVPLTARPRTKPRLVHPGLKVPFILLVRCFAAWGATANLTDVLMGPRCERERVRAVGWENPPVSEGLRSCPSRIPAAEAAWRGGWRRAPPVAGAVGERYRRCCYVSACWPGATVRIGPAPRRTLAGRSQLMVTPSGVACSCRSELR
jgi:hypothetical protein